MQLHLEVRKFGIPLAGKAILVVIWIAGAIVERVVETITKGGEVGEVALGGVFQIGLSVGEAGFPALSLRGQHGWCFARCFGTFRHGLNTEHDDVCSDSRLIYIRIAASFESIPCPPLLLEAAQSNLRLKAPIT
jgi:hypothetical protein